MLSHASMNNNGTACYYPTIDPCMTRMIHLLCSIVESHFLHFIIAPMNANEETNNNTNASQFNFTSVTNSDTNKSDNHELNCDMNTNNANHNNSICEQNLNNKDNATNEKIDEVCIDYNNNYHNKNCNVQASNNATTNNKNNVTTLNNTSNNFIRKNKPELHKPNNEQKKPARYFKLHHQNYQPCEFLSSNPFITLNQEVTNEENDNDNDNTTLETTISCAPQYENKQFYNNDNSNPHTDLLIEANKTSALEMQCINSSTIEEKKHEEKLYQQQMNIITRKFKEDNNECKREIETIEMLLKQEKKKLNKTITENKTKELATHCYNHNIVAQMKYEQNKEKKITDQIVQEKFKYSRKLFVANSVQMQFKEEIHDLQKETSRYKNELYKKTTIIKRLQNDLHHYYNRRRRQY